ncbi:MAG TPA: pyrimidine dimer DNA glycosylase/endonuclease V [Thermoplasmata archaeon]
MRIWDLPVECLCRNHLLAEHRELHAIWSVVLNGKQGYSRHPEVMRWRGRMVALYSRHEEQVREMARRGYSHRSPLDLSDVPSAHRGDIQTVHLEPMKEQRRKLRNKGCACNVRRSRT